jgi:hypothetical protein
MCEAQLTAWRAATQHNISSLDQSQAKAAAKQGCALRHATVQVSRLVFSAQPAASLGWRT